MRDRLAITLNVMLSGLSYANPIGEIDLAEATWLVTILALADGDIGALTTTGSRKMCELDEIPDKSLSAISWPQSQQETLSFVSGMALNVFWTSKPHRTVSR